MKKPFFHRSAGACPPRTSLSRGRFFFTVARGPVPREYWGTRTMARDRPSPYGEGIGPNSVVRERPLPNGSRAGALDLQRGCALPEKRRARACPSPTFRTQQTLHIPNIAGDRPPHYDKTEIAGDRPPHYDKGTRLVTTVVRERPLPNGSRSGDLDLQR